MRTHQATSLCNIRRWQLSPKNPKVLQKDDPVPQAASSEAYRDPHVYLLSSKPIDEETWNSAPEQVKANLPKPINVKEKAGNTVKQTTSTAAQKDGNDDKTCTSPQRPST